MVPRFSLSLGFLLLALPLLAAIHSTPERELAPRQIDLAASDQLDSRIASDGDTFLTVWGDDYGRAILGARLDADGSVIDTIPLTIGAGTGHETRPAIAWGIDRYLVAWQDGGSATRARFVAPDGALSAVIELGPQGANGLTHVAFNGRVFLVVVNDESHHEGDLRAIVVDLQGHVLASHMIPAGVTVSGSDLVAMQGTFYLVYTSSDHIFVLPIDENATAGTTRTIVDGEHLIGVVAAARDDEFLAGWFRVAGPGITEISSVHVTATSVSGVETFSDGFSSLQNIVADRTGYLLLYGNDTAVRARRAGGVTPFDLRVPGGITHAEDAATNGVRTIATLRRSGSNGGDLYATVLSEDVLVPVVLAPRSQEGPDLAAAGDVTLAVWREEATSDDVRAIMAVRVGLDEAPIRVAVNSSTMRVASNGTDWLIIWQLEGKLYGARVAHNGTLIDPTPLVLAEIATPLSDSIAVAWDGTSYVAVYASGGTVRQGIITALYAVRVPATGTPQTVNPATAIPIAPAALYNWYPSIASGPNGSLIVWSQYDQLRGVLLSRINSVTPVSFLTGNYARRPVVAWNRDTFLVAMGTWQREIRLARVDANGNATESATRIPVAGDAYSAYMTIDVEPFGDDFLVYFADRDLTAAVINRDGFVVDGPAAIGKTLGGSASTFGAAGAQFVTQHVIDHPTQTFRIFTQSVNRTPDATIRRRSVR
jgi:hypothetical protein